VRAVPRPAVSNTVGAWLFYGGILTSVVGFGIGASQVKDGGADTDCNEATCIVGWTAGGVGAAAAIGGGIWWYSYNQDEHVEMTLIAEDTAALRPTVTLDWGPGFVTGTF